VTKDSLETFLRVITCTLLGVLLDQSIECLFVSPPLAGVARDAGTAKAIASSSGDDIEDGEEEQKGGNIWLGSACSLYSPVSLFLHVFC